MDDLARYREAVVFLDSLLNLPEEKKGKKRYQIERMRWFLDFLKFPEQRLKIIHVAGTGGKGSAVHYLHEILEAAGKKTGSYYSPHPTTAIERIRVGSKFISPREFAELIEELKPSLDKAALVSPFGRLTYFEVFFAIALLYFVRQKCEYAIIETGLGGKRDATNAIRKPLVCAITNIDYDHMEILGHSLKEIAREKIGILKKGTAFFTTEKRSEILNYFRRATIRAGASFYLVSGRSPELATAIAEFLQINKKAIASGLRQTKFACRFEELQARPRVIIDGAHNPLKIRFLVEKLKNQPGRKIFIFGMAEDKDWKKSLKLILPLVDVLLLTRFLNPYRKSADLRQLAISARANGFRKEIEAFLDPQQALAAALKKAKPDECVVICGSFFLAGELRKNWISEEFILKNRRSF
ncbi:MAG: Mur ligase family protein [bacterium]|nr:Mur ligase family protein [bacterium]